MNLDYDLIIRECDRKINYLKDLKLDEFYNSFGSDNSNIRSMLSQFFLEELKLNLFKRLDTLPAYIFMGADYLPEKLEVPGNINNYYRNAFANANGIKELKLDSTSVQTIPPMFMSNCKTIEHVILPDSITMIDTGAFENCSNLKQINIPQSLRLIKPGAFASTALSGEIILPNGFELLDSAAFAGTNITSITLPDSIKGVADDAFADCAALEEIVISESVANNISRIFNGIKIKNGKLDTSDPLTEFYARVITIEDDEEEEEEEEINPTQSASSTTSPVNPPEEEEEEI